LYPNKFYTGDSYIPSSSVLSCQQINSLAKIFKGMDELLRGLAFSLHVNYKVAGNQLVSDAGDIEKSKQNCRHSLKKSLNNAHNYQGQKETKTWVKHIKNKISLIFMKNLAHFLEINWRIFWFKYVHFFRLLQLDTR
jgi:hypothetical protein